MTLHPESKRKWKLLSCVWLFATPWTKACQASLSFTIFWSLLKLMAIESMMLSNHLIPSPSCLQFFPASGRERVMPVRMADVHIRLVGFTSPCLSTVVGGWRVDLPGDRAPLLRILKCPLIGNCQDWSPKSRMRLSSKWVGMVGLLGNRVDRSLSHLQTFCAYIVCSLVLQRNPGQDKRVSPHVLSIAPEGAFISKGNCRKRVTQYHSLLARTECWKSISQDNEVVSQD